MATTSPDTLRTPDPGDSYNLVADLAILGQDVQDALTLRANAYTGTASQRTAFTSTATDGMLWQDTDDIKMIWRKDGAAWVPAVWRWSGTSTQMNAFTAPNGFEWYNTTDNSNHVRLGGAWTGGWTTVLSAVAGSPRSMYRLNPNTRKVEMRGIGSKGAGYTMFTLPTGMRPSVTLRFHDPASGSLATDIIIQVNNAGEVSYSLNTTATLSLDNVSFAPVP